MKTLMIIITFLLTFANSIYAKDRCLEYIPTIRQYSLQYIGLDFPYWYNVGCAATETSCRADLISFDAGIGLFQLTPSTGITKEISKYLPVDPFNTESNIRAQAFYIHRIITVHFKSGKKTVGQSKYPFDTNKHVGVCGLNLSDVYKFYNSGYWFFGEANIGSLVCSNNEMATKSVRGGTCVGKQYLSFPQISYSYPTKVWNYSTPYKGLSDGPWRFWYTDTDKKLTVQFPTKKCN
jgi:hypothetical protein